MKQLKINGVYRHYKGNEYKVIALAKHSETLDELVIYQDMSDPDKVWARPKEMFLGEVTKDGEAFQRFLLIL